MRWLGGLILVIVPWVVAGCCDQPVHHVAVSPPPPPVTINCERPPLPEGAVWAGHKIPDHLVCLEKVAPQMVPVGLPFTYDIRVTNIGDELAVDDVTVVDRLPEILRAQSAEPKWSNQQGGLLTWSLGLMKPHEVRLIHVTAAAQSPGEMLYCASVTYTPLICVLTRAIQPKIQVRAEMPPDLMVCDPIPIRILINNPGDGPAEQVQINDTLPEGWTADGGAKALHLDVGVLRPGATREFTVMAHATHTGHFSNTAFATAAGGLKAEASASINLHQPAFQITKSGPQMQYIDREANYVIDLRNTGDAVAKGIVIEDILEPPQGFVRADGGATLAGNRLLWQLGDLAPGQARQVHLTLMSHVACTVGDKATATAYCTPPVSASAQTEFRGVPEILLETVDTGDPCELGQDVTYIVTVTNQGSEVDHNIRLTCEIEDFGAYVSSEGATPTEAKDHIVKFAVLPALPPKARAQWRVVVKAVKPGDSRFKVTLESTDLERPVYHTESTRFYATVPGGP